MKKRIISLILAVLMVLSLAACGEKPTPTEEPATPTTEAPATEEPTTEPTAAPTEEPTEAPTEASLPQPATAPENSLALGTVENGTYTNTYAGIGMDLGTGWEVYTADQLQELPDITSQMVEGTELEQAMANVTQFTDFFAENVELLANVNVLFQKLDMSQRLTYAVMDEKAVLDATLQQKDVMIQAYAQGGIDVSSMEIVTVTFCGEEHYALKTVGETQGLAYYCLQVFDFWLGQYSMTITFASFVEDTTEDVAAMFYAVE